MIAEEILTVLRKKITSGFFNPDEKLPTREEFSRAFSVSKATIQNVLAKLEENGFVEHITQKTNHPIFAFLS